ncbi:MAG: DNA translocase FtsK 4TM domain-containing protein [Alphaproteobacteria bacterium]|nr:DNA translocase FtsK 4TM domain-containing protein [Alphaproteobacteria bacterium]
MPVPVQAFLARRLVDIIAATLALTGLFLLISLITYDHNDPSWNTAAADGNITNLGGSTGAWISDLLLQTMGIGSLALAFGFIIWGVRCWRRDILSPLWLRACALLVSTLCLSIALAQIPAGEWAVHPYLGSSAGTLLLEKIRSSSAFLADIGIPGIAAALFLATFAYAGAVTKSEMLSILIKAKDLLIAGAVFTYSMALGFIGWVRHYNDESYTPQFPSLNIALPRLKKEAPQRRAPTISDAPAASDYDYPEDDDDLMPEPAARANIPVVAPKAAAAEKKSQSPSQQKFSLDNGEWEFPPLNLIQEPPEETEAPHMNEEALRKNAELLQNVLADYKIEGDIVSIHPGPVVTLYELEPAPGVKSSRVISLADDIARSMSAVSVRVAVVPGRNVIGIELPNKVRQTVYMQELLSTGVFEKTKAKLPLILGKDIGGQPILADLAKMPHLLVAGTTGSGKSVAVNTMICSILYALPPEKCRFIMIDPKMLELSVYDDIPHLLSPVVTEPGKAVVALKWTVKEMEDRYRAMSKLGVRNIEGYNARVREAAKKGENLMRRVQTGFDPDTGKPVFEEQPMDLSELPYIIVVVDEFADLMLVAGKDVEAAIQRLAQMARAAGIHLIMATQRPSVDVITGVIKANFPTRISFSVTSKIDSRTILGEGGAEQLLGMGDMLYMAPGGRITRVHGPFVSDKDVEKVCDFLRNQSQPQYIDDITDEDGDFGDSDVMNAMFGGGSGNDSGSEVDELYDQAVALVAREGKASTSFVQRYLQIGYNRAARIIEEMERQGIISKASPTGKREILVRDFSDV